MGRWIRFFFMIALGAAAGLVFGWFINPVKYVDTAPASLREDYRNDFVLMVSEAYRVENNLNLSVRRLALLGSDPPETIVNQAIQYAGKIGYNHNDIGAMQVLADALATWNPSQEIPPP